MLLLQTQHIVLMCFLHIFSAQIGIFYIIYYACLAGFWAAMMAVFYQTLDWNDPRLSGPDSLLKQNPGKFIFI